MAEKEHKLAKQEYNNMNCSHQARLKTLNDKIFPDPDKPTPKDNEKWSSKVADVRTKLEDTLANLAYKDICPKA